MGFVSPPVIVVSRFVVTGGCFHLAVTFFLLETKVLCCGVNLEQAFSLDLWVLVPSIPRRDMWQMPLLALKQNLFYTGRTNQSQWSVAFKKMNVIIENCLNLWFSLFIFQVWIKLYVLRVASFIRYILLNAECLICTEHMKFNICYTNSTDVASEMEGVLSQCYPSAEESLTQLTDRLMMIRNKWVSWIKSANWRSNKRSIHRSMQFLWMPW